MGEPRRAWQGWRRGVVGVALTAATAVGLGSGLALAQREQGQPAPRPGDRPAAAGHNSVDGWKLHSGIIDANLDSIVENGKAMYRVSSLDVPVAEANTHFRVHVRSIQNSIGLVDEHLSHLRKGMTVGKGLDAADKLNAFQSTWKVLKDDFNRLRTASIGGPAKADLKNRLELFYSDATKANGSFDDLIDKLGVEKVESIKPSEPSRGPSTEQR